MRALAPEVGVPEIKTEIPRDYMPDSNEMLVGKDIVRTAWRHAESGRNAHSASFGKVPQRLKPSSGRFQTARVELVPFPKSHRGEIVIVASVVETTRREQPGMHHQNPGCESHYEIVGQVVVTELSEIPCRVSSDLHEWRNESATVLPTGTANL